MTEHNFGKIPSDRKTARIAADAAFLSLALILSYVESLLPHFIPIPGFKLGLASLAGTTLYFMYGRISDVAAITVCRVAISSLLFGSITSFAFGLTGGLLTAAALLILGKTGLSGHLSFIGVSVICALFHNAGQLIAAVFLTGPAVLAYIPYLMTASIVFGGINGILLCGIWYAVEKRNYGKS